MKFSVCIINWNWLEILKPTIDRLRKERESVDLEIIVLDNASEDGSAKWLKEQTDVTSICNTENLGSAVGRNQMIKIAQGDYILMLDSDILYINGSLEYLCSRFNNISDSAKCVGFNPILFTNNLDNYEDELPKKDSPIKNHADIGVTYALTQYGLFKRDMFDYCMFDETYGVGWGCEDDDLFFQMKKFNFEVYQIDCLYFHAKNTEKWQKSHKDLPSVNYYERAGYFREKWDWRN